MAIAFISCPTLAAPSTEGGTIFKISTLDVGSTPADCAAVVLVRTDNNDVSACSIGGASATLLASHSGVPLGYYWKLYGLISSSLNGATEVRVTVSSNVQTCRIYQVAYSGVSAFRSTAAINEAANATPSLSPSSTSGDTITLIGTDAGGGNTFAATAPATARSTAGTNFAADRSSAGDSTIAGSLSGGLAQWGAAAVGLAPAGATSIAPQAAYYRMMQGA